MIMERKLEAIKRLIEIMDQLRQKCPWDREQTMLSLRNNTIEECFELTDAIVDNDMLNVKKELGDLLLHIVFYSKIASESGNFDLGDVANAISEKLIYRHPHVFSNVEVENAAQVSQNWEALKSKEKDGNKTILSGIPRSMPSLPKACRIQQKAQHVGFDWENREDVWDKVNEEMREVKNAVVSNDQNNIEEEFGDLMFAIVNAARLYNVDPDLALERTNKKFISRFTFMELEANNNGKNLHNMTLEQMDQLWNRAKSLEK